MADQPDIGRAALDELGRLNDILAINELVLNVFIHPEFLQRRLRGPPIRRVARVGDGDFAHRRIEQGLDANFLQRNRRSLPLPPLLASIVR